MPDPVVVGSTIVAAIIGGVGLWWSSRNARRAGVGSNPSEAITNLQAIADTWEQRYELEHSARVAAELVVTDAKAAQAIERELAAQCRHDLDDARSEIRTLRRRRSPGGGS